MKTQLVKMLCLVAVFAVFSACGGSSGSKASSVEKGSSSTVDTSKENWWESYDFPVKLELVANSSAVGQESGPDISSTRGYRLVEERSRGAIKVTQVFGSALGSQNSVIGQLMEGSIDFSGGGANVYSPYTKYLDSIQLPFLIDSYELEAKVLQLPEWKVLLAKANEDLGQCTIISVAEFGIREIATTTKPINTMADMKNLRMRTAGNPVVDDAMKLIGANPVIVEYSELYSALQNGVIDSEEVNVATVSMQKHYEVVKYINEIGIYPYPIFLSVSNTVLEDAPKPYFDLIAQCFAESNAEYMKTDIYEWSRQTREDCIKNGLQFNTIKDKAEWQKEMLPLYEREAAKDPLIADFIKAVLALKASM